LGCKTAVTQALDWFFSHETQGIILEDDCVPHPSFFGFCTELLQKYADYTHISHIAGYRPTNNLPTNDSYHFVNIPLVWGWATWRRAWQQFKPLTPTLLHQHTPLPHSFLGYMADDYLHQKFDDTAQKRNDSWAYSWTFTQLKHQNLCIIPSKNLIQNIGFDTHATHTQATHTPHATNAAQGIDTPLIHPKNIELNHTQAVYTFYGSQKTPLRLVLWYIILQFKKWRKWLSNAFFRKQKM
jgi:hypothetical protein